MHWHSIPIHVKRNVRAKKVWLRMRAGHGLEVVLPYRISVSEVPAILERHRGWILARHADLAAQNAAPGQCLLPSEVVLHFLDRKYFVRVEDGCTAMLREDPCTLRISVPPGEEELGVRLLQRFLIACGKRHLVPFCQNVAEEVGIPINRVGVRNQATRWGSCSGRFDISLNAKLLFLPQVLVRHVVLHELCHVEHRSHGAGFHRRLQALDPKSRENDKLLRLAWDGLPVWSRI